jgi:hypothetical protein
MNGRHTRQGGRFAKEHRVVHAHTQTAHNRACGSLAAPTGADWPRPTASNHGTRFDSSRSARHNAARRQIHSGERSIANLGVTPWTGHSVVPYGTGGIGGLTMFERPEVGVHSDETFLATNVGGGAKWYSGNNRWGLRGDYRFAITRSKDDAPEFFGRDTRYIHRVYGGVIINMVR